MIKDEIGVQIVFMAIHDYFDNYSKTSTKLENNRKPIECILVKEFNRCVFGDDYRKKELTLKDLDFVLMDLAEKQSLNLFLKINRYGCTLIVEDKKDKTKYIDLLHTSLPSFIN